MISALEQYITRLIQNNILVLWRKFGKHTSYKPCIMKYSALVYIHAKCWYSLAFKQSVNGVYKMNISISCFCNTYFVFECLI